MIETNCSLKPFNTFSIEAKAQTLFHFNDMAQLPELLDLVTKYHSENKPVLILGAGSNTLFCEDFSGLVIKVELLGVDISTSDEHYILQVAAGEDWHQLVTDCIAKGIDGLENLALIPGVVGSAPVQNIGAYGTEFKDFCESVEYVDLLTGELVVLSAAECLFAYRDSIFKHTGMSNALITKVTLTLSKQWQPHSRYGSLQNIENQEQVSAKQIYDSVCQIRNEKLPDPEKLGNVGSFFKNPVVSQQQADALLRLYPNMPNYPQNDKSIKLAAGWLIDQAGLKGKTVGGAAVHKNQALVLINQNNATSTDVILLADLVRTKVEAMFNVSLEHEVRFIGREGETNLQQVVKYVRAK